MRVIEIEPEPIYEIEQIKPNKPTRERRLTVREKQMQKPIFESDYEKYDWLIQNGCTNTEDRKWIENYIKSNEYKEIYGD